MNIWMVTRGCYSDYHVVGIFSSEEGAIRFCEAFPEAKKDYDGLDIEKMELDPSMEEINNGLSPYFVKMLMNGDVVECKKRESPSYHGDFQVVETYFHNEGKKIILADVWARDQQHAIKIVNEKRAIAIASGQFD